MGRRSSSSSHFFTTGMPMTADSTTPVSSMALKNASMPPVSWTKLRKWRWPSTRSYLGAGLGESAAKAAATASRRRREKR